MDLTYDDTVSVPGPSPVVKVIKIYDHRRDRPDDSQDKYGIRLNDEINCEDVIDFIYNKINTRNFILTFVDRTPLDSENFNTLTNKCVLWILNEPDQK